MKMVITFREAASSPLCFTLNSKAFPRLRSSICRASLSVQRKPSSTRSWNPRLLSTSYDVANFDPLGINPDLSSALNSTWESLIVFQILAQVYPKLQDLQKREGEAGRKKVLQYTRYASVGFAIVQAIGQVLYLRPYVNDFSTKWVLSSVIFLTLGAVFTTYIGERITDLKLGNGTSLLIFTNIISYLPASLVGLLHKHFRMVTMLDLSPSLCLSSCWYLVLFTFRKQREKFLLTMLQDTPAEQKFLV